MDDGEIWTLNNKDIRMDRNITLNRDETIKPVYGL
jgi:hypothetical protein